MVLREAVHLLFAGVFVFGIYYQFCVLELPDAIRIRHTGSGGQLKYLTVWNLLLQAGFFIMSFVNDVVLLMSNGSNEKKRPGKLQRGLDTAFTVLAFPVSFFVFTTFWGIYNIDRELIFPRLFDAFFPSWLNHIMHSVIGLAVLVEMLMIRHHYLPRKYGLLGVMAFFGAYLAWINVIAYVWDFWTYPFLVTLNFWQRMVFFVCCVPFVAIFYLLGEFLHGLIWGRRTSGAKKEKKSKSKAKKKSS